MVSKYVYTISDECSNKSNVVLPESTTILSNMLIEHKMKIGNYYTNKKWDKFKKQNNVYELIFTTGHTFPSLSSYLPISRSFFKHWEILHDFEDELGFKNKQSIKASFLAEGPGGFIEAFSKYRSGFSDQLFGMTLISSDRCVPNWKLPKKIIEKSNIKLLFGEDNTGSLYNIDNINHFVNHVGLQSCDYITADGGFDFSNNFNNQEEISLCLISREVYTALKLQKQGGAFLLKTYDINLLSTRKLLFILKQNYIKLHIIKPLTSRPANSEKYILCTGYQGLSKHIDEILKDTSYYPVPYPSFLYQLDEYNALYIMRQIISINNSLVSINCNQSYTENLKLQLKKGIKWLHKYKIPVLKDSISFYKKIIGTSQIDQK